MAQRVGLTAADETYINNYSFPEGMDVDAMEDELGVIVDNYVSTTRRGATNREKEQIVGAIVEAIMERYRREQPQEEEESIQDMIRRLQQQNALAAEERVNQMVQRDDLQLQALRELITREEQIAEDLRRPRPTEEQRELARRETATRQAKIKADLAAAQARLTSAAAGEEKTVFGECPLCLEPINYGDEAVDAHDINSKPSGHVYCKGCIMNICNYPKPSNRICPECRAPLLCDEIKSGIRDINTNLGLKGGKRMRKRSSKRSSKRSRRHVKKGKKTTRKGKKDKKYTNKRMRRRRM
jgi:hypothetical protein